MEYPTIFYRTPGVHSAGGTLTYDYVGVKDEAEAAHFASEGWHESLAEALGFEAAHDVIDAADKLHDAVDDVDKSARAALETEARTLGVSFNWKTSDQALAERIAEKKAE